MTFGRGHPVPQLLLTTAGGAAGLTDRHLLERFASRRDEAAELAFAVLVERHGPLVLRTCRGALGNEHDAQDAFQAVFLVLARKARSLAVRDSLGPWLYSVALRVAARTRAAASRRRAHERKRAEAAARPVAVEGRDEIAAVVHEEVDRLPGRYRAAVVLCDLEGLTHQEAARRLGWPVGTVKSRQSRARERLRARLIRRGLAPSVGALGALLSAEAVGSAPPALVAATVRAALNSAAPGPVAALAEEVLKGMAMAGMRALAASLLTIGAIAIAGVGLSRRASVAPPSPGRTGEGPTSAAYPEAPQGDDATARGLSGPPPSRGTGGGRSPGGPEARRAGIAEGPGASAARRPHYSAIGSALGVPPDDP
jgi:HlyD family secretion protein